MPDGNVVATARDKGFVLACEILGEFGPVKRTDFYNVLILTINDVEEFLERFAALAARDTSVLNFALSRVVPVTYTFTFETPEAFEEHARAIALQWTPQLANKSFHVRLHRRGFKGKLSSPEEERLLDEALLDALQAAGTPGSIAFDDPDAVIVVETIGTWAGLSLWTRADLQRYPFIRAD
jgi:tRNA(Ser,Leu) C12 N-acetylase TAN1